MNPGHWIDRLADKLERSKFFAVSLALHFVLIVALGMTVVTNIDPEPPDLTAAGPLVESRPEPARPPENTARNPIEDSNIAPTITNQNTRPALDDINRAIRSLAPSATQFLPPAPPQPAHIAEAPRPAPESFTNNAPTILGKDDLKRISKFTDWTAGPSTGQLASRKFEFTAFLGKYSGDWNSAVTIRDGRIAAGSLPNLLYLMTQWSDDRIRTNERNVEAVPLDSPRLLTDRPPFIFLTGTRSFRLTDAEVENLRLYIRNGGAVWGDSSVPGRRSAFDISFREEMQRVIGGGDSAFEPLPADHPVFTGGYFPSVRQQPPGVNFSNLPVEVLRWGGEVAVLHTTNAYGCMWRVGLDRSGSVDLGRNARNEWIATDPEIWNQRESYVRNLDPESLRHSYEFGINLVVHLLTRWEKQTALQSRF